MNIKTAASVLLALAFADLAGNKVEAPEGTSILWRLDAAEGKTSTLQTSDAGRAILTGGTPGETGTVMANIVYPDSETAMVTIDYAVDAVNPTASIVMLPNNAADTAAEPTLADEPKRDPENPPA